MEIKLDLRFLLLLIILSILIPTNSMNLLHFFDCLHDLGDPDNRFDM